MLYRRPLGHPLSSSALPLVVGWGRRIYTYSYVNIRIIYIYIHTYKYCIPIFVQTRTHTLYLYNIIIFLPLCATAQGTNHLSTKSANFSRQTVLREKRLGANRGLLGRPAMRYQKSTRMLWSLRRDNLFLGRESMSVCFLNITIVYFQECRTGWWNLPKVVCFTGEDGGTHSISSPTCEKTNPMLNHGGQSAWSSSDGWAMIAGHPVRARKKWWQQGSLGAWFGNPRNPTR